MDIKVFGPGCAKCAEAEKLVRAVAASKGITANIEKISGLKEMMKFGILSTPAVVIDGVVKVTGRVPGKDEVSTWLDEANTGPAMSAPVSGGCACDGKC